MALADDGGAKGNGPKRKCENKEDECSEIRREKGRAEPKSEMPIQCTAH